MLFIGLSALLYERFTNLAFFYTFNNNPNKVYTERLKISLETWKILKNTPLGFG